MTSDRVGFWIIDSIRMKTVSAQEVKDSAVEKAHMRQL